MIKCYICREDIVKYKMDLGDTIVFPDHIHSLENERIFICDSCAKFIAKELIER